jgi:vitamin B12 transporter
MVLFSWRRRALALVLLPAWVHAQTADPLAEIVVTATRTPQRVEDILASVTVLDRAAIEARQAGSVEELLRGEAGIDISNGGGLGKVTSVFMRGMQSDHVLVLVDGVRLGSATLGTTAFQFLPVDQIERIEIVRGPRSSLYGSDALGGVIQIFTKRGSGEFTPEFAASGGSHSLQEISGGVGGSADRFSFSVSGSYQATNGYNSCLGAPYISPASPGGGCFTFEPDDDGFRNASFSGHVGFHPSDDANLEAYVLRARGRTDFDSSYQNREDFVQQVAGLSGHWSPNARLRLSMRAGESRDEELDSAVGAAVSVLFPVAPSTFNTKRQTGTVQSDWQFTDHSLITAGVDYLEDQVDSDTPYVVHSRRDTAVFGQWQGVGGAQSFVVSARHDDNQQFGGKTTGGAAWGFRLADGYRLSASFGTAFKAPTFNELYYPFFGNVNLKPENSRSVEIGLDRRAPWGNWSLHAYETHVDDLIASDANFTPANIDSTRIRGVEAELAGGLAGWTWGVTANWLDPRNVSDDANHDKILPRRPRQSGRLELSRAWRSLTVSGRFNIEGRRFDDLANSESLGGYSTLDLLLSWRLNPALSLQAKLANLGDRQYQTALYYPQDGRNYLLTIRYAPRSGPGKLP